MTSFIDTRKRTWTVPDGFAVLKAARNEGVALHNPAAALALADDPVKLSSVIYAIVGTQARERGVDLEDFCESLDGEALQAAHEAIIAAAVAWLPERQREAARKIVSAMKYARDYSLKVALDTLNDPDLDAAIARTISEAATPTAI